jgi:acyl-CoA thioesterase YciA
MREVVFHAPVFVGDLVSFFTRTKRVGNTSVTVEVTVEAERGYPGGPKVTVTAAEMVFVHVGQDGRPLPVPART